MSIVGQINTAQKVRPEVISAPVGGLNGRDPLADMPPQDAYFMDNVYPDTNSVRMRSGSRKNTSTPLEARVDTLAAFSDAQTEKLLAWAGTKLYDVSSTNPIELSSGITKAYVQYAMFSNSSSQQRLVFVNGVDTPKEYDGTGVNTLTMTGITNPNDLVDVLAFKGRLYFAAKDSLSFYYLPVGQVQGALAEFDLAQVAKLGGHLKAIATYSEGGETPQDYIVFITSKGECIVYAGVDPSNVNSWSLVGRFFAAPPIGRKCAFNFNGELILITLSGAIPFTEVRRSGSSEAGGAVRSEYGAITTKLGTFLTENNVFADTDGWEAVQFAKAGYLLINVPTSTSPNGRYVQYVMNATTGAWCRYVGWDAVCLAVFDNKLYYGAADGHVYEAETGENDDGEDIQINVKQAFNYFSGENEPSHIIKHFQWAEIFYASTGLPALSAGFGTNFEEEQPLYLTGVTAPTGAEWDTAEWDVAKWDGGSQQRRVMVTLNRHGSNGSLWLRGSLRNVTFEWFATQYVIQRTRNVLI